MLNRIVEFFVGNLDSESLKHDIKESKDNIVVKNFGKIGGDVYFIKPSPDIDLAELFNILDKQQDGRLGIKAVDFFVGGPFILTRTDENAINHHQLYTQSLSRPKDYIKFTLEAIDSFLKDKNEYSLKELVINPIRKALAKGLFNIEEISSEFAQALESFTIITEEKNSSFSKKVLFNLVGAYYSSLFKLFPKFTSARNQYISSAEKFIATQIRVILEDFQLYINNIRPTNIITLSILELIKEEHPEFKNNRAKMCEFLKSINENDLNKYLNDAYIRTLPAAIVPGDNLVTILMCALTALAQNPQLLDELRSNIFTLALFDDTSQMQSIIESDKRANGFLHRFYLESLRRESLQDSAEQLEFDSITWRYTNKNLIVNDKTIPANSMIAVLNALPRFDKKIWQEPNIFNPARFFKDKESSADLAKYSLDDFSVGHRKCPAFKISEYIIKAFVCYIVYHYDLNLKQKEGIGKHSEIRISLKKRENKEEFKFSRSEIKSQI